MPRDTNIALLQPKETEAIRTAGDGDAGEGEGLAYDALEVPAGVSFLTYECG